MRKNGCDKILFHFLCRAVKYPLELIAVEKEIQLGDLKKRFDILVYDRIINLDADRMQSR
jgi:hypothetical protein